MAERRMFSKTIIDSDLFLDMPASAQNLYFHLSLRADDEGFVNNPRKIQKIVGASDDDIKILLAKKYILLFESGIIVVSHWKVHNYIQKDRFKASSALIEKAQLRLDKNNVYILDTEGGQLVYTGKDSLVEDRQEKDRSLSPSCKTNIDKENKSFLSFVNKIRTNYKPNPIQKIFPRILKVEDEHNDIGYLKVKSNGYLYISFDTKTKDIPASEAEIYWLLIFNNQNQIISLEDQYKQETSQFEIDTDVRNTDGEEMCEEVKKLLTVEKF